MDRFFDLLEQMLKNVRAHPRQEEARTRHQVVWGQGKKDVTYCFFVVVIYCKVKCNCNSNGTIVLSIKLQLNIIM